MEKIIKFSEIDIDKEVKKYMIDDKSFEELVNKCLKCRKKSELIEVISNSQMSCEQKIFFALNYGLMLGEGSDEIPHAKLKNKS